MTSLSAAVGVTNAFAADWTHLSPVKKEGALVHQYGKLGLVTGLSLVIGPILGSSLGQQHVLWPTYAAFAGLALAFFLV